MAWRAALARIRAYFANRFVRQKSLDATVVFTVRAPGLSLAAYDSRRTVLSPSARRP